MYITGIQISCIIIRLEYYNFHFVTNINTDQKSTSIINIKSTFIYNTSILILIRISTKEY